MQEFLSININILRLNTIRLLRVPGAPIANKTANPGRWAAVCRHCLLQNVLPAENADLVVVNLDAVDDGTDIVGREELLNL